MTVQERQIQPLDNHILRESCRTTGQWRHRVWFGTDKRMLPEYQGVIDGEGFDGRSSENVQPV